MVSAVWISWRQSWYAKHWESTSRLLRRLFCPNWERHAVRKADETVKSDAAVEFQSGQKTAKKAAAILVTKSSGFIIPTAKQKQNLLVAFAKKGKVVYGKAFDIVKLSAAVNLSDLTDIEKNIQMVTIFEIKSTKKKLQSNFAGYFFALTAAEVLVAQSLKKQFKFVFVNTTTREYLEMDLADIFTRAKGIYPTWSVSF